MAWKFGTIDFSTFGVMVSRSSGVLDLPKLKTEGYDWLNLDGRDYWQNEPKYNDREIVLNCWMYAEKNLSGSGYENFQSKIYAFTEAVLLQKKVDFETPYLTIPGCSIKEGVTVIRETNYVNDAQIGTFTLRITVQGASNYNLLNIYGYSTDELRAVVKTNNLIITKTLQGEMSASCSFESNVKLDIRYFDFIQVEYNGNGFDRFLLLTEPSFVKKSTNKYVYSLKFEHSSNWLSRSQLTISSGETDFYFYGDLEDVVDLIITSQTRASNLFRKGIIPATIKKNHKFSGEDCLSVLRRMCNEYDLEYEFKYIIPGYWYDINIAKQIANDLSVTLEFGKGKGQYELARGARIEDEFFTVLWAFGAAKNLKHPYRGGLTRLSFDGNPLQQNVGLYGYKEKTIYFDDVFPQRTAPITAYYQVLPPDLTPLEKELYPNGIFRIYDEDFNFDLENYMIGGLTPKVRMKTGALAGHEFEIQEFKFDLVKGAYLFIIPFNDETGFIFPNATLKLAATDEYTLIDMSQPSSYEAVGENALQAAAIEELAKGSTPKYEYSAVIDPAFIAANPTGFEVGDRLTLIDADYNINGPFRIAALNYNDFTKIYNLTFSDKATLSRLKLIERQVQEHERTAKDVKDDEVETMRNRQQTPGELRRKLLDPSDEKLNVDNIVRNNSLDPRMLDLSAGTLQWGIHNALVDVNIGGDFDKAEIGAGSITYHNYDGDTRRDIARSKELAIPYDPTRTWDIPATDFNLASSDPHWMYLRIPLDDVETECEVIVSKDHIDAKDKIADNIIYLKIGGISSSASPRFAYMIWGNVKPGGGIPDAPNDGKTYGRKNKTWAEIIGGAGDYTWKLHSPEEIIGYITEPANIVIDVDGIGAIDQAIEAGVVAVSAINEAGETLASEVPAFGVLIDSTTAIISWDAVEGATGYRIYYEGKYLETEFTAVNFLNFIPNVTATIPEENTAAIFQNAFTIEKDDTVEVTGEGIDVETTAIGTKKSLILKKQRTDWNATEGPNVLENKPQIPAAQIQSDWNQADTGADDFIKNKPTIPTVNANYLKEWQTFEYRNIEGGTADTFVFDIMADVAFTIDSVVMQVDAGTLTGIALKINGTAVTGISSVTATTTPTRTTATAAKTVAIGDKITFEITTGFTGTPTKLIGKLSYTRT